MQRSGDRFNGDTQVLHRQAVRTPLPDEDAERVFHENMLAVADARERKADLLTDPDVSVLDAHERELDRVAESFERRLRRTVGDDYEDAALAYHRGDRSDRVAALAAYYLEGLWRIQQRSTVTDMLFFPIILRYPDSFTVNIRFASSHTTPESVHYERPQASAIDVDDQYAAAYSADLQYELTQAADYLRETADVIREEFPHPDDAAFEDRKYGGVVSAGGRRGSEFSVRLERVTPDPDRFSDTIDAPVLVPEGPEAERTERDLLPDADVVF